MIILQKQLITADMAHDFEQYKSKNTSFQKTSVLYIHSDKTEIATEDLNGELIVLSLDIGSEKTGLKYFHHQPPTPEEIENAINVVEDELSLAYPKLTPGTMLYSGNKTIKQIANIAGLPETEEPTFSRASIEEVFTRFAVLSMERAVKRDIIPVDPSFSATFLILREVMHHLKFENIRLL